MTKKSSSTREFFFTGKAIWAKVNSPDEKYNNYEIGVFLDKESLEKFNKSGIQITPKKDRDGEEYVLFRRPVSKIIKGDLIEMGSPLLLQASNEEYTERPEVGNGSDVTIKVLVYDTMKGKGHRLEAIRVDKLVEYIPKDKGPF